MSDSVIDSSRSGEPPSKSQLKRDAAEVLDLARRLVTMPRGTLDQLPVPEEAIEPLQLARRTRHHGARKRETRRLAKLLRQSDSLETLRAAVEALDRSSYQSTGHFHALEKLRDRLIDEGTDAINELVASHRDADRQKLRQLIRTARHERERQMPPAASRQLFRYLRDLVGDDDI